MNSLDTEFHRRLRTDVEEMHRAHAEIVCIGALDHEGYKYACGYLRALSDVLEQAQQIEAAMNEGK